MSTDNKTARTGLPHDLAQLNARQLQQALIIATREGESKTFILREMKRRGIKPG